LVKTVILAPYYEIATFLWSPFLKGWVSNELKKRGVETVLLWGSDATRQKLFNAVKDKDVKGTLGVGHGNDEVIVGQNNEILLRVGDTLGPEWRKDCVGPVSCLVGRKLMPYLIQQGVPCGIGEVTEYWFTAEKEQHQGNDPNEDALMKYYLLAEYTFWYRLAEGFTAGEAYKMMIKEYYKQSALAKQVDEETAYYVAYDAQNRKFFGDENFRIREGVETVISYKAIGARDAQNRQDTVTVSGNVVAKDNTIPGGKVKVIADDQEQEVELKQDGTFVATFTFKWDKNEEKTYDVQVIYEGDLAHGYLPRYEETQIKVEPTLVPTKLEITDIKTSRIGPQVHFIIKGRLTDKDGNPVPGKEVTVQVGDGEIYESSAVTDGDGVFHVAMDKSYPPLQTKAIVIASFDGDDVYMHSSDTKTAEFPPNWDVILTIVGSIVAVAVAIAIILGML
jgi:hypothetical protein